MTKLPYSRLGFALLVILLSAISSYVFAKQSPHDGLRLEKIHHDGRQRSFYLHLPPQHTSSDQFPLLLALHGGGRADGDELAERTGYNKLADQKGFIVAYPNGIDAQWNDGRGKTARKSDKIILIDDVGFLSALIDHLINTHNVDPSRVYMTGLSNGGMMTLRMGCEASNKLTAIAPVIANMPAKLANTCRPDSQLPMLLMNGTQDPMVPWQGGTVRFMRKKMGNVLSTDETLKLWRKLNQCSSVTSVEMLPDTDKTDGSVVRVVRYQCASNHADVILYAIEGGGHNFPGSNTPDLPRLLGNKNNDINGPEVIVSFFMSLNEQSRH